MIDIRLGDCVERTREIADASIDLILTSPPYDKLRKYASGSAFDFEGLAGQCKRVLKSGGVLVWVVGDETKDGSESGTSFRQALHFSEIGLRRHDTMIWRKSNAPPQTKDGRRYTNCFEYMFVFSNGKVTKFTPLTEPCKRGGMQSFWPDQYSQRTPSGSLRDDRRVARQGSVVKATKPLSNIWDIPNQGQGAVHPAQFPLQLAINHILSWTNPGDLVLDPFVGSGTTLLACLQTDRHGIGIDKDPTYCEIAQRRLRSATLPLFGAT